jgi:putative thioredoxin
VLAWLKGVLDTQTDSDDPLADIKALETTRPDEAAAHYRLVLGSEPDNDEAQFRLGRLLLLQGHQEATALLEQIGSDSPFFAQAGALLPLAPFFAAVEESPDTLRERAARDPSDLEAHYQLAAALARDGRHAEALELLLGVVRRNRAFRDDGARKAMVGLFALVGEEEPLVHEYRRALANALF